MQAWRDLSRAARVSSLSRSMIVRGTSLSVMRHRPTKGLVPFRVSMPALHRLLLGGDIAG
jgi:hypothetical protein